MNDDTISRQAALELVKDVCDAIMSGCKSHYSSEVGDEVYDDILEVDAILKCNKGIRNALRDMPSAQPEPSTEIQEILNYLDTTLHPIVSPDNWNVYAELHDMVSRLPSAQPDRGYTEQIKWERDLAIRQLADLGYGLGEKPRTQDYKTDHGYMWLCPKCGLPVHSDFEKCVRCGYER